MKKYLIFTFIISAFLLSCSLKYEETVEVNDKIPEFILSNVNITQVKDGKSSMKVYADRLEQYKGYSQTYAKNLSFTVMNDDSEITSEGKCGYLLSDGDEKQYLLYENIEVKNYNDDTKFFADALKYNEKTEQLTGSKSDVVRIEKDGTVIFGSGFAASGITKQFTFSGTVTGDIETK